MKLDFLQQVVLVPTFLGDAINVNITWLMEVVVLTHGHGGNQVEHNKGEGWSKWHHKEDQFKKDTLYFPDDFYEE